MGQIHINMEKDVMGQTDLNGDDLVPAHDLQVGTIIELMRSQRLRGPTLDEYGEGTRLRVTSIEPMPTGHQDRDPWDIVFEAPGGESLLLEIADGSIPLFRVLNV